VLLHHLTKQNSASFNKCCLCKQCTHTDKYAAEIVQHFTYTALQSYDQIWSLHRNKAMSNAMTTEPEQISQPSDSSLNAISYAAHIITELWLNKTDNSRCHNTQGILYTLLGSQSDCTGSHCTPHTHARLTALFPGLSGWAGTRKINQSGFYWSKRQRVAVASAGSYASLHLAPDR